MTITISTTALYFLYYWAFTFVFESIYKGITIRKQIKKLSARPEFAAFKMMFTMNPALQLVKKLALSPPMFIIYAAVMIFAAPVLFPFTLFSATRRLFGYKSAMEKMEEISERAKAQSDDFMRNEGVEVDDTNFNFEIPEHLNEIPDAPVSQEPTKPE